MQTVGIREGKYSIHGAYGNRISFINKYVYTNEQSNNLNKWWTSMNHHESSTNEASISIFIYTNIIYGVKQCWTIYLWVLSPSNILGLWPPKKIKAFLAPMEKRSVQNSRFVQSIHISDTFFEAKHRGDDQLWLWVSNLFCKSNPRRFSDVETMEKTKRLQRNCRNFADQKANYCNLHVFFWLKKNEEKPFFKVA